MVQFHPGTTISHYRIGAASRRGDVGDVYSATDARSNADVHLEFIDHPLLADEQRVRRFVQEAKRAARLHHLSLARILDLGKASIDGQDLAYIVTEPVAGDTLRQRLERRVSLTDVLPILRDAADALAVAHAAGIVHRDLRPELIAITPRGTKVLGLGRGRLTQPRMIWRGGFVEVGVEGVDTDAESVAYMAPELAEGNEVDFRADLFSFGAILYEAATGVSPFLAATPSQTIESIVQNQPRPPREIAPDIPQQVEKIIRRCLAKRPDQRYGSTTELVTALDAAIRGDAEPVAMPPPRKRGLNLRLIGTIAAIAIVVLAVLLALPSFFAEDGKPAQTSAPKESKEISIDRLTDTGDVVVAALSSDGSRLAYVRERDGEQTLVMRDVARGDENESKPAGRVASLTFARDANTIWYTTPDGDLYRVTGGVAVRTMGSVHSPVTFSPNGELLSFVRRDGAKTSLIVSDLQGKSQRTIAVRNAPDALSTAGPAWSPTRDVVACAATLTRPSRRTVILEVPVGRGASRVVTDKVPNAGRLCWLPSGKSLMTATAGRFHRGGWLIDVARGQVRRVVVDLDEFSEPNVPIGGTSFAAVERNATASLWRPDEDEIVAGSEGITILPDRSIVFAGSSEGRGLFWLGASEKTPRRIVEQYARDPAATPNGRFVVFNGGTGREWGLWRAKPDGQEARLLVSDRAGTPREPDVSPDGKMIVYTLVRPGKSPTLSMISSEGGTPKPLTEVHAEMPAISPDGQFVAARTIDERTGEPALAIFNVSGGAVTRRFGVDPISIAWTPDGAIAYTTHDSNAIWKQPLTDAAPVQLHTFDDGYVREFAFAPDGSLAAAIRVQEKNDAVLVRNFR